MNGFFDKIGIDLGILVVMLMILVLILIVIILNMSLGLHRMNRRYAMFMKGADGQSLERQFAQKLKEVDRLSAANEDIVLKMRALQKNTGKTLTKYGIVKYDAFKEVGGTLSFVMTLLTKENDGFIMNSTITNKFFMVNIHYAICVFMAYVIIIAFVKCFASKSFNFFLV